MHLALFRCFDASYILIQHSTHASHLHIPAHQSQERIASSSSRCQSTWRSTYPAVDLSLLCVMPDALTSVTKLCQPHIAHARHTYSCNTQKFKHTLTHFTSTPIHVIAYQRVHTWTSCARLTCMCTLQYGWRHWLYIESSACILQLAGHMDARATKSIIE